MEFFEPFHFLFMQRALIAGAFLGILLASLGAFVTLRRMAFFGEGIAHASLAGIAIAIFGGIPPLPIGILWAIGIALLIFLLERKTRLASDTLIGILFTASMAFGVIIMSLTDGYQPELVSFLFGSILGITTMDLWIIGILSTLIIAWLLPNIKNLTLLSLSEDTAKTMGIRTRLLTATLYIALAITTVLGVKILGIILISALLILPSATSRLLSHSFKEYFFASIIFAEITILGGLLLSFYLDSPSGATIVLLGTALFFLALPFKK